MTLHRFLKKEETPKKDIAFTLNLKITTRDTGNKKGKKSSTASQ